MQYRFGKYLLDTARFALYHTDDSRLDKVEVEPQVLRFLVYLIENRDRVIPRDELFDRMFGRRVVTDNALSVRIRAARQAVGDNGREQAIIATVQGEGYRFIAAVEASAREPMRGANDQTTAEGGAPEFTHASVSSQPSIAILPLETLTNSAVEATVAKGLIHDVTTRVAYGRSLFVIARGTAFQFPSGHQDVREIGEQLAVKYVCQGSAQVEGNRLRISVGLADAQTRQEIWTQQYDTQLSEVLELQEEIAVSIAGSVQSEVQQHEMRLAALLPSTKLDAWSAFHRGLDHMYRFRISECDLAEGFFRKALDLEPYLARPYAGLSFLNYERAYLNLDNRREHALRNALEQALRAVETDPLDPMGHWALSRALFLKGDLETAEQTISVAVELNPSYANAQYFLGWIAMQLGDHERCLKHIELARRLSPRDPLIYGMYGVASMNLALMGRAEEAMDYARHALYHPDLHYQGRAMGVAIFSISGDTQLAREQLQRVRSVKPDYGVDDFFSVYAFQHPDDIAKIKEAFRDVDVRH